MTESLIAAAIKEGRAALGIELGSTRIKAVLIAPNHTPVAQGEHEWENRLENGIWTYSLEDVWSGLQSAFSDLAACVRKTYQTELRSVSSIGISAMMHGYLVFDKDGQQLVPFRTWRNTITKEAAEKLTAEFGFNIPQRWSVAHLYQAILNGEEHVPQVDYLTTLAGYVHWRLTGKKVLGVGDAAGMFPIDSAAGTYDRGMLHKFDSLVEERQYPWKLEGILPKVLLAGEDAGTLTEEGAGLLDAAGILEAGIPLCPPEGDAGTGMAATNSVSRCTGNVSAGTSIFAMVVLEKPLHKYYLEIDMVTTPCGDPVAMVHCNNCTSDINAWVSLFSEVAALCGVEKSAGELFPLLFRKSLEGLPDCGSVVPVNYYSGEGITRFDSGCPLLLRRPESKFDLGNLMRAHIYSTMATLKLGLGILEQEKVAIKQLMGHGGLFKTPGVAQRYLAAATETPVTVMTTAGEGGAWGVALLAAYRSAVINGCTQNLEQYLATQVFAGMPGETLSPEPCDVEGFKKFMEGYQVALLAERAVVKE